MVFFSVESRVSSLELQTQLLTGAATVSGSDDGEFVTSAESRSVLAATCASLAERYVVAQEEIQFATVGKPVEDLMERMGCFVK